MNNRLSAIIQSFCITVLSVHLVFACPETGCNSPCGDPLPGVSTDNGASNCTGSASGHPVRFIDGLLMYSTPSLSFPNHEGVFSFSLSYNNRPVDAVEKINLGFGNNWYPSIPQLAYRSSTELKLVVNGNTAFDFEYDSQTGEYWGRHGVSSYIFEETGYYKLAGTNGGEAWFFGPSNANKGKIHKTVSPYGKEWNFYYNGPSDPWGGNMLSQISEPGGYSWTFTYVSNRVSDIEIEKATTDLATIEFTYYASNCSDGSQGDLKAYTITRRADLPDVEETTYFRYYTGSYNEQTNPGTDYDLKLVIGPMTAAKALHVEPETSFDAISTSTILDEQYFDLYVEYDSEHRVATEEVLNGQFCSSCGSGAGTGIYDYEYEINPSPGNDYDDCKYGVKQTNPDGSKWYYELNKAGSAVIKVFEEDETSPRKWGYAYTYDSAGRIIEKYHPSACDESEYTSFPSWDNQDFLMEDFKLPNSGIVEVYDYYDETDWGNDQLFWGKLKKKSLRIGENGTGDDLRPLAEYTYTDKMKRLHQKKVYAENTTSAETTIYSYEYYDDAEKKLKKITIEHPDISNPASQEYVEIVKNYDQSGKLTSIVDENGMTTLYAYNTIGLLNYKWEDYYGEKIFTYMEYDNWGNITSRTLYDGFWTTSSVVTRKRWLYTYMEEGSESYNCFPRRVTLNYDHIIESGGNVTSRDGSVTITVQDLSGKTIEEAIGKIESDETGDPLADDFDGDLHDSLEDAFVNGRLFQRATYEFTGASLYKKHEWIDAEGTWGTTNFYTTEYAYDIMGRRNLTTDPEGTKTKVEYDDRGRLKNKWIYKTGLPDLSDLVESRTYDDDDSPSDPGDGLLVEIERPYNASDSALTRIEYDKWNRTVLQAKKITGSYWLVTENQHDNADRVTLAKSYLGDGNWDYYYNAAMAGRLWEREEKTYYDARGRVWKTTRQWSKIGQNEGNTEITETGTLYETKIWHDKTGNVIKEKQPGWNLVKKVYDDLGRVVTEYRCYDTDESDSFSYADDVAGDVVLMQRTYDYDEAGRVLLETTYERKPEETSSWSAHYGALSATQAPYARRSYRATWYYPAGRVKAQVDYGDNGGSSLTRPASPPTTRNNTQLITDYEYGFGYDDSTPLYSGQSQNTTWVKTTDPYGKVAYTFSDSLGRTIRIIRNYYTGGAPCVETVNGVSAQRNVTTEFEHDSLHRKTAAIAYEFVAGGSVEKQITQYKYGVSTSSSIGENSDIDSNNLLHRILYGERSGSTDTFSRQEIFAYNRQGLVKWKGTATDDTPPVYRTKHIYEYDLAGQMTKDKIDYRSSGVDATVLAIKRVYDSHGRLGELISYNNKETEDATTFVNSVEWVYDADGHVTESTQDHGGGSSYSKSVAYTWSAGSGQHDYPIKRLTEIEYPGTTPRTVAYTRTGQMENPDWTAKDWVTGRISKIEDTKGSEQAGYAAYDQYMGMNRVMKMTLVGSGSEELAVYYGDDDADLVLDRFGRVTGVTAIKSSTTTIVDSDYAYNRYHSPVSREDGGAIGKDESYGYDNIQRLVKFDPDDVGGSDVKTWELTGAGNWKDVEVDSTSVDTRSHNERNEITARTTGGAAPGYDTDGNTTGLPVDNAASYTYSCIYDAWNRLMEVKNINTPLATYERDGLGRITENTETGKHYYYSGQWQVLAVYDGTTLKKEYVWGTRYIDEILSTITYSGSGSGVTDTRRYHVQDLNWNVVASTNWGGTEVELVTYDPYGLPTFYNGSGGSTSALTSNVDADYLFQGRWLELFQFGSYNVRLYHFRNRAYGPKLGRFLQRDPIGIWGDGVNLGNGYGFVGNGPVSLHDPLGLLGANIGPESLMIDPRNCPSGNIPKCLPSVDSAQSTPDPTSGVGGGSFTIDPGGSSSSRTTYYWLHGGWSTDVIGSSVFVTAWAKAKDYSKYETIDVLGRTTMSGSSTNATASSTITGSATCYWDSTDRECKIRAKSGGGDDRNESLGVLFWQYYIGAGSYVLATVHEGSTKATFDVGWAASWGAKTEFSGSVGGSGKGASGGLNFSFTSSETRKAYDATTITVTCDCSE